MNFKKNRPRFESDSILVHHHHHHHHVMPLARISLTLSRHFSLSFIPSGRSSGLRPISSHNCCMYVRAGRPAFARPYVGVHRSTSLRSSSLLLQQCPACLVRLTWIVFVMGGRWPYSLCLVGCCRSDLFNIARNILVSMSSSFFFSRLVSVQKLKFAILVEGDSKVPFSIGTTPRCRGGRYSIPWNASLYR